MTKRSRRAALCALMLVSLARDSYAQQPFPAPQPAPAPAPAPVVPAVPAPPGGVAVPAIPAPPAPVAAPQFAQATPQTPQAPQAPPVQRTPQAPRTPPTPQTPPAPPRGAAPATPAPAPPRPVVAVDATPGQLLNIQVDVTIVAEATGEAPVRKTVSLTVADRQSGSVRSTDSRNAGIGDLLNVDVLPMVQKNGRILTRVGLEYASAKQPPVVQLRAQPLLESGKGLLVSRAVSPNADRTVTVEITATVLK